MHKAGWFAVALTVLASTSARGEQWSRRFTVEVRPDVHVKTDGADVRIETGGSAAEVTVRVETDGLRLAPDEVAFTEKQTGDSVEIEVRLPEQDFDLGSASRSVSVVVRTPRQVDVEVRTDDGDVEVDGVDGAIRLHTVDGDITALGLSGQLEASSGDGDMDLRGRFTGLELRTGDGNATVAAEPGSLVTLPWSLSSGDGAIVLRLPKDLGAELEARAGDGDIDVDERLSPALTVLERSAGGRLGTGGSPIRVRTADGTIRVEPL